MYFNRLSNRLGAYLPVSSGCLPQDLEFKFLWILCGHSWLFDGIFAMERSSNVVTEFWR